MAAGEIVVSLLAKTGSFSTDIERSTKAAEKRMKEMQQTASQWGAAIGVAFTAAATAGAYMAKSLIDGLDKLNDVADATGASVENISALENAALRTGNSFESVESALIKLNASLKGTDDDGKAARALEAIGLRADDLRKLDPAEALRQTAVALSTFADDGDKARLVQELFGKSVREVGPFLKDLAEKTELVGTVTGEQAKQAEALNHQLAEISKNSVDAKRALLGELLPALNATIRAMREGGGLMGLFMTGGDQTADPGKALSELSPKLEKLRKDLAAIQSLPNVTRTINQAIWGDETDLKSQIAALEKQQKYLQSLQRSAATAGLGDVGDAQSRRMGALPSVGPIAEKAKKGPKGPDPDADFKSYLNNLQQQLQKVDELTVSEKLLDDIRRGSLTVTPAQEKQLAALAQTVDKEKELLEIRKAGRERAIAEGDAVNKANEEYQALLTRLLEGGPAAQLEKSRQEMKMLADEFQRFLDTGGKEGISDAQYLDAVTGRLGLMGEQVKEVNVLAEGLGNAFGNAMQDLVSGGASASDVFKNLLKQIASLILELGVIEPMMDKIRVAMGGKAKGGGGIDWGSMLSSLFGSGSSSGGGGFGTGSSFGNADFGGYLAEGGPASAGTPYIVGERGPELFVPRTAGAVVPNHALGGSDKITVINQTTGRADRVVEQRISPTERALILQEARELVAADMQDPNSRVSRSMGRSFNVSRNR